MQPRRDGAFALQPREGRPIDLGNFSMSVKIDADGSAGALSMLEAAEPPGFGPPMHIHRDAGEAFYVLGGEYRIFLGDDEIRCPAGSFVWVPPGVVHGFRVGGVPSRKLNIYAPAAMVRYFDELSASLRDGAATDERLAAIAEASSMDVLGPVPEGYL